MKLVYMEWVDSYGCSSDWISLEDCKPKELVCKSVGWLLFDGPECKVIVPHIAEESPNTIAQGCGDMTIPTSAIRKIVDLVV